MDNKPTVEQALLFKRLRERDWYGVRDHVIKECLESTGWNEVAAKEYLDSHWRPPRPDSWCPRWSYIQDPVPGEEPLPLWPPNYKVTDYHGISWYLVSKLIVDEKTITVPLDKNLEPTNLTGKKMVDYRSLEGEDKWSEWKQMEENTDGTEGHPYSTFTSAAEALEAHPEKYDTVYIQCPNQRRLKFTAKIEEAA
jgi:hypothetical protein